MGIVAKFVCRASAAADCAPTGKNRMRPSQRLRVAVCDEFSILRLSWKGLVVGSRHAGLAGSRCGPLAARETGVAQEDFMAKGSSKKLANKKLGRVVPLKKSTR
jgi:hypothetical protein